MGIIESASRLFDLLALHDDMFTKYLIPGLSEQEIQHIVAPTGIKLPTEVVSFYHHYNLPEGYQYNLDQPTFFGIYWFLSLEDAVEQYQIRRSIDYSELQNPGWFPLLQEDANFYILDTARSNGDTCPIVNVSEYGDFSVVFVSLEAMFDTIFYWIKDGVLNIESGRVVGDYEGDPVRVKKIAAKINPGVKYWTAS